MCLLLKYIHDSHFTSQCYGSTNNTVISLAVSVARILMLCDFSGFLNENGQQHQRCFLVRFNFSMNGTLCGGHHTIENGHVVLGIWKLRVCIR